MPRNFPAISTLSRYNIAEAARAMYRSGYDFRHFLAGGTCAALIEVIVRTSWIVREVAEGRTFTEALPVASNPRLRTSLLLAHAVAAAVNAGKVAITQNPLALNWAQWLAFFRYLVPQVHWLLVERGISETPSFAKSLARIGLTLTSSCRGPGKCHSAVRQSLRYEAAGLQLGQKIRLAARQPIAGSI